MIYIIQITHVSIIVRKITEGHFIFRNLKINKNTKKQVTINKINPFIIIPPINNYSVFKDSCGPMPQATVLPEGLEPSFQPSEGCALSN